MLSWVTLDEHVTLNSAIGGGSENSPVSQILRRFGAIPHNGR